MIGVDTNVLVRVLVDDRDAVDQCQKARTLLQQEKKIFISVIVLIETIWVIQRAYKVRKKQTIGLVESLLLQDSITIENRKIITKSIDIYKTANIDFSDACILASNTEKHCCLHTFDKKLGKHPLVIDINGLKQD